MIRGYRKSVGRSRLVVSVMVILLLMLAAPVEAEICWGKVCDASTARIGLSSVCCSGHGTCTGFNQCTCKSGFEGKECATLNYCGYANASPVCYYNCSPRNSPSTKSYGFCSNETTPSLTYNDQYCICNQPGWTGTCCVQYQPGSLSSSALDFGNVTVGATASPLAPVLLANTMVAAKLSIQSITLSGSSDFTYTTNCTKNVDLLTGGNCTFNFAFTPSATGSRSATLVVNVTANVNKTAYGVHYQLLNTTLTGTGIREVSSVLVDPNTPTTVFAGVDGAGIYRSTNAGSSWTAATIPSASTRIKALIIKTGDSTKLFAATYGAGVYTSTDSGVTWTACTDTGLGSTNVLSLVANSTGTLYAGTDAGVYTSSDSCVSWSALNNGLPA